MISALGEMRMFVCLLLFQAFNSKPVAHLNILESSSGAAGGVEGPIRSFRNSAQRK